MKSSTRWKICVALALSWGAPHGAFAELPASRLDLMAWKVTLPEDTDLPGNPDEVQQPQLAGFVHSQFFFSSDAKRGVVFLAPCAGVATKGSKYPRCELREMTGNGLREATWGTDDDRAHTLAATIAITRLPYAKPHVVCAQIHDAKDDVLMVRLEGATLLIERKPEADEVLDHNYRLGTRFKLRMKASKGRIRVWYDDELRLNWAANRSSCYFKVGCYTQSNAMLEDRPDASGEVVVSELRVDHSLAQPE